MQPGPLPPAVSQAKPRAPGGRTPLAFAGAKRDTSETFSLRHRFRFFPVATGVLLVALATSGPRDLHEFESAIPRNDVAPTSRIFPPQEERSLTVEPGPHSVAGAAGVAVSVSDYATRLGLRRMALGGNAVDAAVTMAFVLAVTHPSAGNIGGGGFALVRVGRGETYALDFRETSPEKLERSRFQAMIRSGAIGPYSVGIPGSVAGLVALHERFGSTPFAELVEPARVLAAEGHVVSKREAQAIATSWKLLRKSELGGRRWGRARLPVGPGTRIRLPELARTLERIRDAGRNGFYEGPVAQSIVSALGEAPQMTLGDLSLYQAKWRAPLKVPYRGFSVTTMPPPSAGGVALATGLRLLESYDFTKIAQNSKERAHLLLEVMRRAQADRRYGVVDPDTVPPVEHDLRIAQWLNPQRWQTTAPIDPEHATDNAQVTTSAENLVESDQTTHFAVVDGKGMAVSLTTTLSSGFGSKVVTSSGIVLNNSLGSFSGFGRNQPSPSQRTVSSMAPTLVDDRDGLRLILGTPGGDSIPSTLLQLINLLVDYAVPLDSAVDAPRIHQGISGEGQARSESARPIRTSLRVALEQMGHHFTSPTAYMGHANCIVLVRGTPYGYVDPREGGLALGLAQPSP